MSWTEHARALVAYNWWANRKVLDAAAGLSREELDRDTGATFGSIGANLRHQASVEMGWHSVLARIELQRPEGLQAEAPMEDIQSWFDESRKRLQEYVAGLTDAAMDTELTATRGGTTYRWPAWQVLAHLMNHSAHHRAETGVALAAAGQSPGDMDFIYFVAEHKA